MENKTLFSEILERQSDLLERIRHAAHEAHAAVNQFYGVDLPYSYHLDGVAELVARYGGEVCTRAEDVPAVMFGAWFHDSIEDARLTYNDVRKRARSLGLDEAQAFMAAEIVYALTNEKGRTRAERAGVKYYEGIRAVPYGRLRITTIAWPEFIVRSGLTSWHPFGLRRTTRAWGFHKKWCFNFAGFWGWTQRGCLKTENGLWARGKNIR